MADSLTEFAKLARDEVERGVFEAIVTHDALMPLLRFKSFSGNAYVYNRESTLPSAYVHQVGGGVATTVPTFTKRTAALTTIMSQANDDLYIVETRDNVQDPKAATVASLSKALTREIARQVIQGNSGSSTGEGTQGNELEGITSLIDAESRWRGMDNLATALGATPGSAETTLTIPGIELITDDVDDGRTMPDCYLMNTTMRRKVTALARASGSGITLNDAEMLGHQYRMFNGVPLVITNWITNAEQYEASGTWPSSTATTIFAIQFGEEKQGHVLIHNGPVMQPRVKELAIPVDEHAVYTRMYVYANALFYSKLHVVGLGGIDSAT